VQRELVGHVHEDEHGPEGRERADDLVLEAGVAGRVPDLEDGIWIGESECEEGEVFGGFGVAIRHLVDELREKGGLASAWVSREHEFEELFSHLLISMLDGWEVITDAKVIPPLKSLS
jgi:hypothetical protein